MFVQAALLAQDYCDAIDLNLGCPQMIAKRGEFLFWGSVSLHKLLAGVDSKPRGAQCVAELARGLALPLMAAAQAATGPFFAPLSGERPFSGTEGGGQGSAGCQGLTTSWEVVGLPLDKCVLLKSPHHALVLPEGPVAAALAFQPFSLTVPEELLAGQRPCGVGIPFSTLELRPPG